MDASSGSGPEVRQSTLGAAHGGAEHRKDAGSLMHALIKARSRRPAERYAATFGRRLRWFGAEQRIADAAREESLYVRGRHAV